MAEKLTAEEAIALAAKNFEEVEAKLYSQEEPRVLKQCPFNHKVKPDPGSPLNDEREVILVPWLNEYAVVCTWCGAMGPYHNTEEEAEEAWNAQVATQ
jgi:hypothetical protein